MRRNLMWVCCMAIAALLVRSAIAQDHAKTEKSSSPSAAASSATADSATTHDGASPQALRSSASEERAARLEGEKRFRTNCGRCHQPPHKFPPRVMATAIRHMRVRAMITDEDMRLILKYMTQ
jgi:mono/diheme cytochrome c family protein